MLRKANIWSVHPFPSLKLACSFLNCWSTALEIRWMMIYVSILLGTDKRVILRQLLQFLRLPFLGILTVIPSDQLSGILPFWLHTVCHHQRQWVIWSSCQPWCPAGIGSWSHIVLLFFAPLEDITAAHGLTCRMYADDSQIYVCFDSGSRERELSKRQLCTNDVMTRWFSNGLMCNPGKTEVIHLSSRACSRIVLVSWLERSGSVVPLEILEWLLTTSCSWTNMWITWKLLFWKWR